MGKSTQPDSKVTPSPKKKTPSATKDSSTTKSRANKTEKTVAETAPVSGVNTTEIINQVKDADTIINSGIAQIDRITPRLDELIEKSSLDVTTLRDKASENGSISDLNAEISTLNHLNTIKARISRYSSLIRDNNQNLDKRVAFVGIVIPLIETVDDIGKQKG